jgi:integrase
MEVVALKVCDIDSKRMMLRVDQGKGRKLSPQLLELPRDWWRMGKGASIFKMMDVSRHKSVDTLRGYVRDAELFKDHAGAGLL